MIPPQLAPYTATHNHPIYISSCSASQACIYLCRDGYVGMVMCDNVAVMESILVSVLCLPPPSLHLFDFLWHFFTTCLCPFLWHISHTLHWLYAYGLCLGITTYQNSIQWGACTLECQETLQRTFSFAKIEIAGTVPHAYSYWFHTYRFRSQSASLAEE